MCVFLCVFLSLRNKAVTNHVAACHKWDRRAKNIDSTRLIIEVVVPISHGVESMNVKYGRLYRPEENDFKPEIQSTHHAFLITFLNLVGRLHRENLDIWMDTVMAVRMNVMKDNHHRRHLHGVDRHRRSNHSVCISFIHPLAWCRMKQIFIWIFWLYSVSLAPNDPWAAAMGKVQPNQDSNNWARMDNQNQERYDRTYNERNPKYIDGSVNASNSGNRQSSFINNSRTQDRYNNLSNRFDGSRFN